MSVGILGRKVGMTQVYDAAGNIVPVTAIEAGPCTILQVRTQEADGYQAVQLGFDDKPRRLASRSERGHVSALQSKRSKLLAARGVAIPAKAGCEPVRYIKEFRLTKGDAEYQVGQSLTLDAFKEITHVDVIGKNKGRGFAGVMKKWNFSGLGASHGVQRHHRAGGSVGSHGADRGHSGKIKKGKKMSGRWGNERVTVRNLKVVRVDIENNIILVNGSVPGPNGAYVMIQKTTKFPKKGA